MSLTPASVPTVSAWSTRLVPRDTSTVKGKTQFVVVPPGRNPAYSIVPGDFRDHDHIYDPDFNPRYDHTFGHQQNRRNGHASRDVSESVHRSSRAKKKRSKAYFQSSPGPGTCGPQYYVYPEPDPAQPLQRAICHPVPFYVPQFLIDPHRFSLSEWSRAKENGLVLDQLAYYFSPANLCKDFYLRSLFNKENGGVPVCELIKLTRLANLLASDVERLVHVVQCCPFLELLTGTELYDYAVRVHDWERWIF